MPAEENPPSIVADATRPSVARMYDWYLGGNANFAVDREFGAQVRALWPHVKGVARQNRDFLRRAVVHALDAGVRQFLDLGSGVPTAGNVHEIVRASLPPDEQAAVVYVDNDEVAVEHANTLLADEGSTGWAGIVPADLRDPAAVLGHDVTTALLDERRPVCVLMIAVLHFVDGEGARDVLAEYTRRAAPGSWLALTHLASDEASEQERAGVESFRRAYDNTGSSLWVRDYDEVAGWLHDLRGWELLDPGVVHLPDWRPDREPSPEQRVLRPFAWCGAARKTG